VYMCIKDMYDKYNMAKNKNISIGQLGEDIAVTYLKNRNYHIVVRNYRKKWGELDIVCIKDDAVHFVEVKAGEVYSEPKEGKETYRPEDHVDRNKKMRLRRIIETYLQSEGLHGATNWTVDVMVVQIDAESKKVYVKIVENVLL